MSFPNKFQHKRACLSDTSSQETPGHKYLIITTQFLRFWDIATPECKENIVKLVKSGPA